ncbi:MAG: hypothetical protein WCD67_22480, partial [Xanthobacteraceae bacterium]
PVVGQAAPQSERHFIGRERQLRLKSRQTSGTVDHDESRCDHENSCSKRRVWCNFLTNADRRATLGGILID